MTIYILFCYLNRLILSKKLIILDNLIIIPTSMLVNVILYSVRVLIEIIRRN